MAGYLLPRHVYVCAVSGTVLLLDLRADRYHGLDREQTRLLSPLVVDWPVVDTEEIEKSSGVKLARNLVKRGLLTTDTARGKSAKPIELPLVKSRLYEWDKADWTETSKTHMWRMAVAYARTAASVRFQPLERTVRRLEFRKARTVAQQPIDLAVACELSRVFRTLRPFFYTTLDQCLFDSLVLMEFFALYNLFPTWVIGVKPSPFSAHSWVQIEHYLLNGQLSFVSAYTPILAIY